MSNAKVSKNLKDKDTWISGVDPNGLWSLFRWLRTRTFWHWWCQILQVDTILVFGILYVVNLTKCSLRYIEQIWPLHLLVRLIKVVDGAACSWQIFQKPRWYENNGYIGEMILHVSHVFLHVLWAKTPIVFVLCCFQRRLCNFLCIFLGVSITLQRRQVFLTALKI